MGLDLEGGGEERKLQTGQHWELIQQQLSGGDGEAIRYLLRGEEESVIEVVSQGLYTLWLIAMVMLGWGDIH